MKKAALAAYYFLGFAALGCYLPHFPRWLEARGIAGLEMGIVAAATPAMGMLGPPAFGLLADAFGLRGWLLRVASFGALGAFAVIAALAATSGTPAFAALIVLVGVFAFFRSATVSVADVMALETVGGASYGRLRLWGSVGFAVAAAACGRFVDPARAAELPLAISAALGASALLAFALPARGGAPARAKRDGPTLLGRRDVRLFLAIGATWAFGHAAYDLCYSLHLRDLGLGELAGWYWTIGVAAEIVLMLTAPRWFGAVRAPSWMMLALAGAALRWLLIALFRSPAALAAVQLLHASSFALVWLAALTHVRERSSDAELATLQGSFWASVAFGATAGMLVWGAAYRRFGGARVFELAALATVVALLLARALVRRTSALPPRARSR